MRKLLFYIGWLWVAALLVFGLCVFQIGYFSFMYPESSVTLAVTASIGVGLAAVSACAAAFSPSKKHLWFSLLAMGVNCAPLFFGLMIRAMGMSGR